MTDLLGLSRSDNSLDEKDDKKVSFERLEFDRNLDVVPPVNTERVPDDWRPDELDMKPASWGKMAPAPMTTEEMKIVRISGYFADMVKHGASLNQTQAELFILEGTKDNSHAGYRLATDLAQAHKLYVEAIERYRMRSIPTMNTIDEVFKDMIDRAFSKHGGACDWAFDELKRRGIYGTKAMELAFNLANAKMLYDKSVEQYGRGTECT